MIEYVICIIMIFLFWIITRKMKNAKLVFCVLTGGLLYLVIALKYPFLGNSDTLTIYYPSFNNIIANDMEYIFYRYFDESILFYVVTKIITLFTTNIVIYYALIQIPITVGISKIIYKYSKIPTLSYIMFFSLNYFAFCFIALKHAVAFGILVWALNALLENKKSKFIILTILASLFHLTSIVFLVAYPIYKSKVGKGKFLILGISLMMVLLNGKNIFNFIFTIISNGRYSIYATRNETINLITFFINLIMLIFSYVLIKEETKQKYEYRILMNLLWIGTIISSLTVILAEFIRISMYFSISSIILLPNVINEQEKKQKVFYYFVVTIFSLLYCFGASLPNLNLIPYKFYWS